MRILVTGGAGSIGIFVCQALLSNGFQVRVFDVDGILTRKSVKALHGSAEMFWGDITDSDSVQKAMQNIDGVIHMASLIPAVTPAGPGLTTKVNVGGTQILIDAIMRRNRCMPFVYASSASVFGPTPEVRSPLSPSKDKPNPKGIYAETKLQAENLVKASGIDHVILRLASHWQSQIFSRGAFRFMFNVPLENRIEIAHPEDTAVAMVNAVKNFDAVKSNTLVVSSGPEGRMFHKDRVNALMKVFGLPMPPASRFTQVPHPSDWYDTKKSQDLLHYQNKTFADCIEDYKKALASTLSPTFLPLMRYIIGPTFGSLIVRRI